MLQNTLLLGTGSYLLSRYMKKNSINSVTIYSEVHEPITTVSIILTTLNEEESVEMTLQSLLNQSIIQQYPQHFEIILVDGGSIDRTVEISTPYVDKIINIGKGKLTARHIGTENAAGNIIVAVDADTYYPINWLNKMLSYYYDKNVIAVTGNKFFLDSKHEFFLSLDYSKLLRHHSTYHLYYNIRNTLGYNLYKIMSGTNSSYLKKLYYDVGGFDLTINQQNTKEMVQEEEVDFYHKLSKLGKVIRDVNLPVFTSDRQRYRDFSCDKENLFCEDINNNIRF